MEFITSIFSSWKKLLLVYSIISFILIAIWGDTGIGLSIMIGSAYLIAKACDVFELSADYIGRNMKEGVKGATVNAIGSSMPEMLTTVFFLIFFTGSDIADGFAASVGGDTGSAIFNSIVIPMLVIGTVLATVVGIKGIKVSKKVILRDGVFLILAEILLLILLSSDYITAAHGWIFTTFYFIYLTYTLKSMTKEEYEGVDDEDEDEDEGEDEKWYETFLFKSTNGRTSRAWKLLLLGTIFIAAGSALLVFATKMISMDLGINPLFISFVLVAAASSIPDTILSLKDAKKGNYDDALSNVLGSNIFDITISMGLPLGIYLLFNDPIDFKEAGARFMDIRIMLVIVTAITMAIFYFSAELSKKHVAMLAVLYILFITYSVSAGMHHEGIDGVLANKAGEIISFIDKPGGITDSLRTLANNITGSWK